MTDSVLSVLFKLMYITDGFFFPAGFEEAVISSLRLKKI